MRGATQQPKAKKKCKACNQGPEFDPCNLIKRQFEPASTALKVNPLRNNKIPKIKTDPQ